MSEMETIVEVMPERSLEVLSQHEVDRLLSVGEGNQREILRRCALAVLNVGSRTDSAREVLDKFANFDIRIIQQERGIKLAVTNAPPDAFVEGEMIRGIRELLFAVVRDVAYVSGEVEIARRFDFRTSDGITNAVFHILRNAGIFELPADPNLVVCWGGHAINREEYEFCKEVGYQLGLRKLNVCTGCGSGAMKGPMKGATIGHAKQRIHDGRYIGLSEPGIIAAESPNPIVNRLVIMPDMEKRLEAFVRIAHVIVIFPGGVGTAEELLYLLGILMHPENRESPVPIVLAGPAAAADYFKQIDDFVGATLGEAGQRFYEIELGNPSSVANKAVNYMRQVRDERQKSKDAYYFNWQLKIESSFQTPFEATHEEMAALKIHNHQDPHLLAANLRRAFSGLVAGNVKEEGIRAIEKSGPFEIRGEPELMSKLDRLLSAFVSQGRMRLGQKDYEPCYRVVA
jgi:predicted Rossmann-fold nucleotide-binding protein